MGIRFSPVIPAHEHGHRDSFFVKAIDLSRLSAQASPVAVLDDFRVRDRPFGPHPHAGFSAVTYVFEDSQGSLRSRDSLGNDFITGPGGLVWSQTGSGMMHEETPAEDGRELHGLQLFVNLSSRNKIVPPQVFRIESGEVPEWHSKDGDRVRVLCGEFEDAASPLLPAEPFTFLDIHLQHGIRFPLAQSHHAIAYVVTGDVRLHADDVEKSAGGGYAVGIQGATGTVTFEALTATHLLILSGTEIREPSVADGPFLMNDSRQITDAIRRYASGSMGRLEPRS